MMVSGKQLTQILLAVTNDGIWKTIDGGTTWVQTVSGQFQAVNWGLFGRNFHNSNISLSGNN